MLLGPRLALFSLFLTSDYLGRAYDLNLWPFLGFIFLPWTTLAFAYAQNEGGGLQGPFLALWIVALITDLVRPAARGTAMGMLQLSSALGSILGPPLGGYIAENVGLPVVFRVGGGFAIVAGVGILFMLRSPGSDAQPASSS